MSTLPKIGLDGLAAKKISPVMKGKSVDHDQKRTLARLSPKDREKDQENRDEDDLEVLEKKGLTRMAKKPWTASSKSTQNLATGGDGVTPVLDEDELPEPS
ncbi:hypothetical protein Fot_28704 [Forsythia ovata]|uniref:Uncharacterized protein n=1 Tax=Forsythia ovata TaxID=205694 RepID=A0ABD1NWY4_9LAMI